MQKWYFVSDVTWMSYESGFWGTGKDVGKTEKKSDSFVIPSFDTYQISKNSGQVELPLKGYFVLRNLIRNVCIKQFIHTRWALETKVSFGNKIGIILSTVWWFQNLVCIYVFTSVGFVASVKIALLLNFCVYISYLLRSSLGFLSLFALRWIWKHQLLCH